VSANTPPANYSLALFAIEVDGKCDHGLVCCRVRTSPTVNREMSGTDFIDYKYKWCIAMAAATCAATPQQRANQ
jgi:hypothetical protein